jgi:hypothetical protein
MASKIGETCIDPVLEAQRCSATDGTLPVGFCQRLEPILMGSERFRQDNQEPDKFELRPKGQIPCRFSCRFLCRSPL